MKWVTRERPRVDRIACPWLIKRFVDEQAEFLYAPGDQVMAVAEREGATPYDVPDVELGHHGAACSFDAIIKKYDLTDPALQQLARIVRGADTDANTSADRVAQDNRVLHSMGHLRPQLQGEGPGHYRDG